MNIFNKSQCPKNNMGEMMIEETAIVTEVRQNYAEIMPYSKSGCDGCQSSSGCTSLKEFFSFLTPNVKNKALRVSNPIYAKRGDKVVIGVKSDALLTGSIMMYFIPLVFLLVGATFGSVLFTWLGLNAELGSIVTGLVGLFVSLLIIRVVLKMPVIEQRLEAVIIRVISVDGLDSLAH